MTDYGFEPCPGPQQRLISSEDVQYKYLPVILTETLLSGSFKILLDMMPKNFTSVAGLKVNLPTMMHTLEVTFALLIMRSPLLSSNFLI